MPCNPNVRRTGFTLIELLVVISIIALLVAMLLPALGKAKAQSLRLRDSANIRGMVQGFFTYATDQKGTLPSVAMSLGTDPFWFKIGGMFDFTSIFNDYGLMPLTANPVLGSPTFNAPENTANELALPWYYYPGVNSGTNECVAAGIETANAIAPIRLDKGTSQNVIMQDQLVRYSPSVWACTLTVNTGLPPIPSPAFYHNITRTNIYIYSLNECAGVYAGTYDGAVTLRRVEDSRWSGYNTTGSIYYVFSHYQP